MSASLTQLQDQLAVAGHGYRPDWEPVDDVLVVEVPEELRDRGRAVMEKRILPDLLADLAAAAESSGAHVS